MPVSLPEHFEEFAEARREGFLRVKELKDSGKDICGAFCQYTPAEIIRAAGLIQVALCGQSSDPIKTAETRLPANLCPLIKSSYGFAKNDPCPVSGMDMFKLLYGSDFKFDRSLIVDEHKSIE